MTCPSIPPIVTVKRGSKTAANEVDAITGATISSKAVVRIINEGNTRWLERLPGPGEAPTLRTESKGAQDAQIEEARR